jgi:hypothetical protein
MFNLHRQVIDFQGTFYIIKRMIKESSIKAEHVQDYKEEIHADTVLKKDNWFYFVNKIEEVVEEEQS